MSCRSEGGRNCQSLERNQAHAGQPRLGAPHGRRRSVISQHVITTVVHEHLVTVAAAVAAALAPLAHPQHVPKSPRSPQAVICITVGRCDLRASLPDSERDP